MLKDMQLSFFSIAVILLADSTAFGASLVGSDHYYRIQSVGSSERKGAEDIERNVMYLRPDYNPYYVQEIKSSYSVSCYVEARHIEGDVFTATCPPGCDRFADRTWGSGVYKDDSCFCAAAIHDGIISAELGGAVTVRKIEGKSSYIGNVRNGIATKSYGPWTGSFIFQNAGKARRPTYDVTCDVQANWIKDTDFNVVCPSGCDVMDERVWGTGVYTDDSYICTAALHDGRITGSKGGEVHVIKTGRQTQFVASEKNNIASRDKLSPQDSFKFEDIEGRSSATLEVSCYFRADYLEEEVFTVICPPGCDSISDQVYGTGIYTQDSFLCASAIHAGRIHAPMGGMVTVMKSYGKITFLGSLSNGIASKNSDNRNVTSYIFQDSIIRQPALLTGSCEMRGDHLKNDVATLMCDRNCDQKPYEVWGSESYKSQSHVCAAAAHAGIISVSLGGPVTVRKVPGLTHYAGNTKQRIISKSSEESKTAFVFADNIQKVGSVLAVACDVTAEFISDDTFSLKCPPGCVNGKTKIWGDGVYTSDSPLCAAAVHDGKLQDSLGGKITVHKIKGKAMYGQATRNGIQSFDYGAWSSSSVVFQNPCVEGEQLNPVTCETRANFMVDESFTVVCPAGCDAVENEIWGTGIYSDDSYICSAAIHDRRLNADVGGQIAVGKVPGMSAYASSEMNGIQSRSKGKWRKSFVFQDVLSQFMSSFTVTCDVEANMILDNRFSVICPPNCDVDTERVWGTDVYTQDSYICAAAIHAGKIQASPGGRVTVVTTKAQYFHGTSRNDISSKTYDKATKAIKFM